MLKTHETDYLCLLAGYPSRTWAIWSSPPGKEPIPVFCNICEKWLTTTNAGLDGHGIYHLNGADQNEMASFCALVAIVGFAEAFRTFRGRGRLDG